ncbi:VWA domain-containing protein [Cytobacillus solani]|uniref:vWA domain-containing protein n=1 Tax=Cytobacillus solani TaxID=1637975 RepID=UPI00207A8D09|nr:vWA domain-containing protein [Cytobacillus solani]USK55918.1 VWA domain-containing protein [Cytobacillus solani]
MKVHKYAAFFLLCLLLLNSLILTDSAAANISTDAQKMDAVLVVDVSNSMKDSDKNKISNEAMKMFIDMLSKNGDKVGMVAYTDQIIREKALMKIGSDADKNDFKKYIDTLSLGAYTDIAVGVSEAVKILDAGKETDHTPLIILLTDGNNYLNPNSDRTEELSGKELDEAIRKSKSEGYPIYTIGLNADGTLNKMILEKLSGETGGKFFTTTTADDLPRILSEIFANHLKLKVIPITNLTGNGQFQDVNIEIPNNSVMEANISITSGNPIEAKLFSPDGKEVEIPSIDVYYSKSKAYSLIKLIKPESGNWKVQIKGVQKDKIDINMVFNYDLGLRLEEPATSNYKKGDMIEILSFLESSGQKVNSPELYQSMNAKLIVSDTASNTISELTLTNDGKSFHGEFTIPEDKKYELKVVAEDNSFYRETDPIIIDASVMAAASAAPEKMENKKDFPWLLYVMMGIGLIFLAALAFYILSFIKKANKGFIGHIVVEIRDEDTGEKTTPQYRKLNTFKGKIKLHQLLQLAPEYIETESIILVPGKNDTLTLFNKGEVIIEKAGRAVDASKGITIKKNDRLKAKLSKVNKSISLDYLI